MSWLGAILLGWSAVHLYVAASYVYLLIRRGGGDEYLGFALLNAFLSLYAMGASVYVGAVDEATAATGLEVRLVAIGGLTAAYVGFGHQVLGAATDRIVSFCWIIAVAGAIPTLSGLFVDPAEGVAFAATWVETDPDVTVRVSPVAFLWAGTTGLCGLVTTVRVARAPVERSDVRFLVLGGGIIVLALFHDLLATAFRVRTVHLLEHTAVVGTVLVSWMLLNRFLRTSSELAQRTDELMRTFDERRMLQKELVRKEQLAAVGELSAVIAHEVRNPLAVLKNAITTLRRPSLSSDVRQTLLGILDDESNRLNRLVADLLTYARPMELQSQPISIRKLIEESLDRVRRATPRSEHIRVELDLERLPEWVVADGDLIDRVLINVYENALQAMPSGGTLEISGDADTLDGAPAYRICIRDTGEGMDTMVRLRANEPFFTTKATGTGLGLAIVSRIVGAHGGSLEYVSRRGETGTTVNIVLPVEGPPPPPKSGSTQT